MAREKAAAEKPKASIFKKVVPSKMMVAPKIMPAPKKAYDDEKEEPLPKKITAVDLGEIVCQKVVLIYGASAGMISDRDSVFTSFYWFDLCFHFKIKRRLSTAFHPQTDEQTERQNQNLEHYLRTYALDNQTNWTELLFLIQFVYQNSKQSFLKMSFFYVIYDYNPNIHYELNENMSKKKYQQLMKK